MKYTRIASLACIMFSIYGCANFDHREKIAYQTLVTEEGVFNQAAYEAALKAKFPPDSNVEEFHNFVVSNNGECNDRDSNKKWCEIPYQGGVCWARLIGVEISVHENKIEILSVVIGGLSC